MKQATRGALLRRVQRYQAKATANDRNTVLAFLEDAYSTVWERLTAGTPTLGRVLMRVPVTGDAIELPSNFLRLDSVVLMRSEGVAVQLTQVDAHLSANHRSTCGYWLEGPGAETTDGITFTEYGTRLRFAGALPTATTIEIRYIRQPPTLADVGGDPLSPYSDTAQDEIIVLDTFSETVESAVVNYARVFLSQRDPKDQERATALLGEATSRFLAYIAARDQGPSYLLF